MELIFNNQLSILIDILPFHLTPKQCTKLYTSNLILYNIYNINNKFESNYFTPKTNIELYTAVNEWYYNREAAIIIYGYISFWNTKNIIDMHSLFAGHSYYMNNFNYDISDWNTSNVQNMNFMFYNNRYFNQNLNNWNMSNVKIINHIFHNALNFDKLNCIDWSLNHISNYNKLYMFGYTN